MSAPTQTEEEPAASSKKSSTGINLVLSVLTFIFFVLFLVFLFLWIAQKKKTASATTGVCPAGQQCMSPGVCPTSSPSANAGGACACPADPRCTLLQNRMAASAVPYSDIDPSKINSPAVAQQVMQSCNSLDLGACADFVPYICSAAGAADFCSKVNPAPNWCASNPISAPPTAVYGIDCSKIRKYGF